MLRLNFATAALRSQSPAPEARQIIAHGETVGGNAPANPPRTGAKEFSADDFLPPLPGLGIVLDGPPTVSPWAIFGRHSVAGNWTKPQLHGIDNRLSFGGEMKIKDKRCVRISRSFRISATFRSSNC
jgi:hypothetical protein